MAVLAREGPYPRNRNGAKPDFRMSGEGFERVPLKDIIGEHDLATAVGNQGLPQPVGIKISDKKDVCHQKAISVPSEKRTRTG